MDARTSTTNINLHKIVVTTFRDHLALECERQYFSLPEMRDVVLRTVAETKKKLPWLKFAEFGDKRTAKGSLRHDANVVSVSGVELDYDATLISIEDVVAKLKTSGFRALAYTSPSNTKTEFKWRVLAPFSKELLPKDRAKYAKRLAGALGITLDNVSFTLSQSFYYGRARDNENADHKAFVVDGDFVDLRDDLAQFDPPPSPTGRTPSGDRAEPEGEHVGFEGHLAVVGDGPGQGGFNGPLTRAAAAYARRHGEGLDRAALKERLREAIRAAFKKSDRSPQDIERYLSDSYLDDSIASAIEKYGNIGLVLDDKDHMGRARKFREMERPHLLHYRGTFWDYHAGAYSIVADEVVNADVWNFLDGAAALRGKPRVQVPFRPNRSSVGETLAALEAVTILSPHIAAPSWLGGGRDELPPEHIISFPNGLLDLRDNKLHPPDPCFFTTAALGFNYLAAAPEPVEFKRFLEQIYESDESEIQLAQEIFGYLLSGDTSLEKAFFFIGPRRSGKGTMMRVLQHLLATSAVAGPTLKSLGTQLGLQPLIGKQVAIVDDLRVSSPKETDLLVENILKITGRGHFTIDRKFTTAWEGTLPVKLVFVSNVMPKLGDDSGAVASRFVISNTRQSFYDREDPLLFRDRLLPELPGIFHWAMGGLQRLRERGKFAETEAGAESKERLALLGSPVLGFIEAKCDLHPDKSVPKDVIYSHWCSYAAANGLQRLGNEQFFAALYAAAGGKVHATKKRDGGRQVPSLSGIDMSAAVKEGLGKDHENENLPF
jgi:putative DNA primase/helicase